MPTTAATIRAAVGQPFAAAARSPDQERKFPVGPASAKKLGYDPREIDALPPSVTDSFCGVGYPLRLGEIGALPHFWCDCIRLFTASQGQLTSGVEMQAESSDRLTPESPKVRKSPDFSPPRCQNVGEEDTLAV